MPRSTEREVVNVTPAVLCRWPLPRPGEDKKSRGRVLVVGGARQTPGAVLLAAEAALRTGAGKLQVAAVTSLAPHLALALPEAAVYALPENDGGEIDPSAAGAVVELASSVKAVLLGPGMSDLQAATGLVAAVLPELHTTTVLDALALAHLTDHPDGVHHLDGRVVLTPNSTELARTLHIEEEDDDDARRTVELAETTGAVVSSGGPVTWVAAPATGLWQVETGGPGLGVSGSGDVQAGVVLGLCARGAEPEQAAAWAAYLHGRAGDRLAAQVGALGFLARELPSQIAQVLSELEV